MPGDTHFYVGTVHQHPKEWTWQKRAYIFTASGSSIHMMKSLRSPRTMNTVRRILRRFQGSEEMFCCGEKFQKRPLHQLKSSTDIKPASTPMPVLVHVD